MNRTKTYLFIILLVLIAAAIFYYQYRVYRIPIPFLLKSTPSGEIMETNGVKHSIPLNELVSGGVPKDGIPSIDNPKFEDIANADQYLKDDGLGLDVEVNGKHRFYSHQILVWHEIVNEHFDGKPLLITFCPLCFTGVVFEPIINNEPVAFGTSGKLYNNNLVMYDRKTDTLWSQAKGEAIVGELTGQKLVRYPSLTISWNDFKRAYPEGQVLSRKTGAVRDYTRNPYGTYFEDQDVFFPLSNIDPRLPNKVIIYGIRTEQEQSAYTYEDVKNENVINDTVGGVELLVIFDQDLKAVRGFNRIVNEETLTFLLDDGELIDRETESVWSFEGNALSGPMKGTQLEVKILENSFWFSWAATFPQTKLYSPNQ